MSVSTLVLTSPIWDVNKTRKKLQRAVLLSRRECKQEMWRTISDSIPAGKSKPGGGRRSRRGQPPAVDTGKLFNTIREKKTGEFSGEVKPTVKYAGRLENELDRKFVEPTAKKYKPKFYRNIEDVFK